MFAQSVDNTLGSIAIRDASLTNLEISKFAEATKAMWARIGHVMNYLEREESADIDDSDVEDYMPHRSRREGSVEEDLHIPDGTLNTVEDLLLEIEVEALLDDTPTNDDLL